MSAKISNKTLDHMLSECKEWGTMDKDKTMYEEFHLKQTWPLEVFKACLVVGVSRRGVPTQ